jgi:hypothetical protein
MSYWQVTVQFETENDRGRIQKTREVYLVDAMSGTEAEGTIDNFKITSLVESKIIKVIS